MIFRLVLHHPQATDAENHHQHHQHKDDVAEHLGVIPGRDGFSEQGASVESHGSTHIMQSVSISSKSEKETPGTRAAGKSITTSCNICIDKHQHVVVDTISSFNTRFVIG
jgi:hypothetical protein